MKITFVLVCWNCLKASKYVMWIRLSIGLGSRWYIGGTTMMWWLCKFHFVLSHVECDIFVKVLPGVAPTQTLFSHGGGLIVTPTVCIATVDSFLMTGTLPSAQKASIEVAEYE